jgi:site-specific DNA-cytosine methylase
MALYCDYPRGAELRVGAAMIFGSLCSGIEAASVASKAFGWKPAFFSEIEKFPNRVLEYHYPETPPISGI